MFKWIIGAALKPFLGTLLDGYKARLAAQGDQANREERLAVKAMELDAQEARLNADRKRDIIGHWYAPENLFAYFIAFPYWFTVITLDFLIFPALGIAHATAPLKGETAAIMAMIMTFWFGKRAVTSVAQIIAQAFGKR